MGKETCSSCIQLQSLAHHAHRVLVQPVQVGLLMQPWRRTRTWSLLRQHFLHYFSEEAPRWERSIRASENSLPRRCVNEGSSGGPCLMRGGRVAATVAAGKTAQREAGNAGSRTGSAPPSSAILLRRRLHHRCYPPCRGAGFPPDGRGTSRARSAPKPLRELAQGAGLPHQLLVHRQLLGG